MTGRKPKPTALKIIKGTARKHRMNDKEPKPETAKKQAPPGWLNVDAKKEWKRLIAELTDNGIVTNLDLSMLAALCQLWGEYIAGIKTSEPVSMAHVTQMRLLAAEFGLTPSSRSKVEAIPIEIIEHDPWDDL